MMMNDAYTPRGATVDDIAPVYKSLSWSPGSPISGKPRAIHCHTSGTYTLLLAGDTAPVTLYLLQGAVYPYAVKQINAPATTADLTLLI